MAKVLVDGPARDEGAAAQVDVLQIAQTVVHVVQARVRDARAAAQP